MNLPWRKKPVPRTDPERAREIERRGLLADELIQSKFWALILDECHEASESHLTAAFANPDKSATFTGAGYAALKIPDRFIKLAMDKDELLQRIRDEKAEAERR